MASIFSIFLLIIKAPSSGRAAQLIFELDEDMFLLLKCAEAIPDTFEIITVPRNAQYTLDDNATEISSDFLKNKIISSCNILKPDIITDDKNTNNKIEIKD